MNLRYRLIFALALFAAPSVLRADLASDTAAQKKTTEQAITQGWGSFPDLGEKNSTDILQIGTDHGKLFIKPGPIGQDVKPEDLTPHRLKLVGMPGHCMRSGQLGPNNTIAYYNFVYMDFSHPENVFSQTMVTTSQFFTQITRQVQFKDHIVNTMLMQQILPANMRQPGINQPAVTFTVQEFSLVPAQMVNNNKVTVQDRADSFSALCRAHPDDVDHYLRPVLDEIGQSGALFSVDSRVAWQVFATEAKFPDDLPPKVAAIVKKLDADAYSDRVKAGKDLKKLGENAALYLMAGNPSKQHTDGVITDEQFARIQEFLHPYQTLTPKDADAMRSDKQFLLDCLYTDDIALRDVVLNHLNEITKKTLTLDLPEKATLPQKRAAIDKLRDEVLGKPTTQKS